LAVVDSDVVNNLTKFLVLAGLAIFNCSISYGTLKQVDQVIPFLYLIW